MEGEEFVPAKVDRVILLLRNLSRGKGRRWMWLVADSNVTPI